MQIIANKLQLANDPTLTRTHKHMLPEMYPLYVCYGHSVRLPKASLDDTRVAPLPVFVAQSHGGKQLVQLTVSAHDAMRLIVGLGCALQHHKIAAIARPAIK
eukprot:1144916-Pelagomonas_calceolata.AAC.20